MRGACLLSVSREPQRAASVNQSVSSPVVTAIVPTRNNARTIEACLESVRHQTYPVIELIVVDNHSTDCTASVAARLADRLIVAGPERSAQRNTGIEAAAGEWILWLDSDMILPPDTISVAMDTAMRTGAQGIALPERTVGDGFWTACRALERECYLSEPRLHNPRLLPRDFMLRSGAFNTDMSGPEDTDLRLRMRAQGARIELAPIIIDHDEGRLTVRDVMSKRYYYGQSIPVLAAAHDGAISAQGSSVARAYGRNLRILLRRPLHAAGMISLRALEAGAYLWGARQGRRARGI